MIEMPPKTSREFRENPQTGEVRCSDPSCHVTQCGQCFIEQGKRKREKKRKEAAAQKEAEAEREREKVRQAERDGKKFTFTYDREEEGEAQDASRVMQQLEDAKTLQEQREQVEREEQALLTEAEERGRQAELEAAKGAGKKGASDGKTKWNHTTRKLLYRAIMKFNPFAAAVKKDAWATISEEMATSTAGMNHPNTGDFRVKTDGHGLEVFYDRQTRAMDQKTAKEDSTSGQTGAHVTAEEKEEYELLAACRAKEKDAAFIKQRKRESKQALEDLRNNEVNDAVRMAALSDKPVQIKLYKVLQTVCAQPNWKQTRGPRTTLAWASTRTQMTS